MLAATFVPVRRMLTVAKTGAKVEVPACVAVIEQFPALIKLRVEPFIEQIPVEVVEYIISPLPEVVAIKFNDLLFISTL